MREYTKEEQEQIAKIIPVIIESTETEFEVTPESRLLEDLELSSLEVYVLLSDLEAEFDVVIPVEELMGIETVGELCEVVMRA